MEVVFTKIALWLGSINPMAGVLFALLGVSVLFTIYMAKKFIAANEKQSDALNNTAAAQREMNGTMKSMDRTLNKLENHLEEGAKRDKEMTEMLIEMRTQLRMSDQRHYHPNRLVGGQS